MRVVVMRVAEVGRRRREDVGEVGEEEQGREADEEELRAVHGAAGNGFGCSLPCRLWSSPLSRRGGCGRGRPREEASRVALPGGLAESKPAIWVPFVSGAPKVGHLWFGSAPSGGGGRSVGVGLL